MIGPKNTGLVESYLQWLREGLTEAALDGATELTAPFLDRNNDHVQIYAVTKGDAIHLTDDAWTLSDLEHEGLDVATPRRQELLQLILNGFGVHLKGKELTVEASHKNLGQKIHSLLQAVLAVNDMFVLAQPRVLSLFWEDVATFLDQHDVRYTKNIKIAGKSGYDHAIDFLIPRSRQQPERIVKAINSPNKNSIAGFLFALADTRDARPDESRAYAFLNDRDQSISGDVLDALGAYNVIPAPWSERERFAAELAA